MTIRNLFDMMTLAAAGADPIYMRGDAMTHVRYKGLAEATDAVVQQGTVVAVFASYLVIQKDNGDQVNALQVTDEPIIAGNLVWWSDTDDGQTIVHGTVK